jgi:adenosine deaminase
LPSREWKQRFRDALETCDRTALAGFPKTDLHCHALLSAPLETYTRLCGRALPPPPQVFGDFKTFAEYISTNFLPALTGAQAVRAIVAAALERMAADGVVYAEMSFDLLVPEFIGVSDEAFGELVAEECARVADRLIVAPEIGIARGLPVDMISPRLRRWLATGVFRSIDLYDDESLGSLSDFVPIYRAARECGLKLKAHAGEFCSAERVRDSVAALDLHAVQHGVRAAECPEVVEYLATRGTLLHICPTSNRALGVCESFETHPARHLFDHGVRLTVNTDDFGLFGANTSDEILNLRTMGFGTDEIVRIVENGLNEIPKEQVVRLLGC